ncbi:MULTISPECIES: YqhV family protein [Brevibacillus]|uniref:YqhV family protein n=1 Tax=Brevibacillus TaxID=55080 RepID=UPI00203AF048|nr:MULTISPECIES: YqhV family protein [Brevibacillus]MCM3078040.1 YqhV family protein [Brevibacillus invocatus]MCM3427886.1 YqhV family protein [Brevibacillus invocatus]MDH4615871.1 YqhV family protein [Brevibacillus sp. AY1]
MWEKAIMGMAALRVFSGSLEILAALLILKVNQVEKALLINSGLAIVGPLVLLTSTAIGLIGISDRISFAKIAWIMVGISCILIGVRK